jgi:hypothetical protein
MFKKLTLGCATLFATATCALAAPAAPVMERVLARQPAPVQKAIRAQLGDGRLRSINKDDDDGDITYDVEMVRGGRMRSFTVGADGELLDTEVFLEELPETVQQAIKKKIGGATLGEIDKSGNHGDASYDVEMIGGGKTRSFSLDAAGKLTDEEVFLAELPEGIQKAVQKEAGSGTLDGITRSFDSGEVFYDVDVIDGGKAQTLTFDSKGGLVSREEDIVLTAVPDAAQKQIQTLSNGGQLIGITKVTENDAVSFDVDVRQNGKVNSYSLAVDGKVLPSEDK